ncbi:hypothetical protein H2248_007364 [Termitomyces sp. 'cryptogamus']|nr:hypothetical protein H2248_007364 [Termitomyces sp. 'cryptogamus']
MSRSRQFLYFGRHRPYVVSRTYNSTSYRPNYTTRQTRQHPRSKDRKTPTRGTTFSCRYCATFCREGTGSLRLWLFPETPRVFKFFHLSYRFATIKIHFQMSSSALEAAEKLKFFLLDLSKACQASEAQEHEAMLEHEQRFLAKEARFNDLFRDLTYIGEGIADIRANQVAETETVSPEIVEEIMRVAEVGRQAQVAHIAAFMESKKLFQLKDADQYRTRDRSECSERYKQHNIELLKAKQRGRAEPIP